MPIAPGVIRTRVRLGRLVPLIPSWESQRADPEEKRGPAKDITRRRCQTFNAVDSKRPNREEPLFHADSQPKSSAFIEIVARSTKTCGPANRSGHMQLCTSISAFGGGLPDVLAACRSTFQAFIVKRQPKNG